jgi:NAD(P)-dependent dehydrogenase (short-subunit alcohol dehydrogenase family)
VTEWVPSTSNNLFTKPILIILQVIKEIKGTGGEATSIPSSVTTESSVKLLITTAIQTYNCLGAAVNNAGISTDSALFADLSTSAFQEMIQVNILGLF